MTRRAWAALLAAGPLRSAGRQDALRRMELVMGPLPLAPRRTAPPVRYLFQESQHGYTRRKLEYSPEPGRWVSAWLLLPHKPGRRPAALCLHQTTRIGKDEPVGLGPNDNLDYARELALRGWIALSPDYPSFGDDKTDFARDVYGKGYASGTMYGIVNHMRGVDLLASLPGVDAGRIAAIGHSLGGHNSLFAAAFDSRIRAIATSCGFTAFAHYYGGNLKGWTSTRYMPRIESEYGNDPKRMPFDFTDVLRAIAPRAVFVNAPVRDSNFAVQGVKEVEQAVHTAFPAGRLRIEYPDAGHEFPEPVRHRAYAFLGTGAQ